MPLGDEVESDVDMGVFIDPSRKDASRFLTGLYHTLREKANITFCIAEIDKIFSELTNAHEQFLTMNTFDWIGLFPRRNSTIPWIYFGEILHPMLIEIGAELQPHYIDTMNVPYFKDMVTRIMRIMIDCRTIFMEEIIETIPILFFPIYQQKIPENGLCREICKKELEEESELLDDSSPLATMVCAIAHETNRQLWRIAP
jgi:hypothetical protein